MDRIISHQPLSTPAATLFGALLVLASASSFALAARIPVEVTTCGQVVERDGMLTGDLDCSAEDANSTAVTMTGSGTLDLAGFTITGPPHPAKTVHCLRKCTVVGPGTVSGGGYGVNAGNKKAVIEGATITRASLEGVIGRKVQLEHAVITGNGRHGVQANSIRMENTTLDSNGGIPQPDSGEILHSAAGAIAFTKVKVTDCAITNNYSGGVRAGTKLKMRRSIALGNNVNPDCGTTAVCADIAGGKAPSLRESSCDKSLDIEGCD